MKKILLAALLAGSALTAQAAELVVTSVEKGGVTFVSFDLVDANDVAGLQFSVSAEGLVGSIDTANCVAGLPKSFSASCNIKDGVVTIAGFAAAADGALSGASVAVGQISFRANGGGKVAVSKALTSNSQAQDIELRVAEVK
jgi:hypothetical protein